MNFTLCNKRLLEATKLIRFHEVSMFFLCVFNIIPCVLAVLGNLLVIRALWKSSLMPFTIKTLYLSLAVSDLAVGLVVQPMFIAITAVLLNMAHSNNYNFDFLCPTVLTVFWFFLLTFASSSFLGVTFVALDRFLAISLHLRYREYVTPNRVFVALALLWTSSGAVGFTYISIPKYNETLVVFLEISGILATTVAYIQIGRAVRRHRKHITDQLQIQTDQAANKARVSKSAINAFYIYAVFLGCYLPSLTCSIIMEVLSFHPLSLLMAHHFGGLTVFLNSSLNPLIYCWRFRELRDIVRSTLKKMFRKLQRENSVKNLRHTSINK